MLTDILNRIRKRSDAMSTGPDYDEYPKQFEFTCSALNRKDYRDIKAAIMSVANFDLSKYHPRAIAMALRDVAESFEDFGYYANCLLRSENLGGALDNALDEVRSIDADVRSIDKYAHNMTHTEFIIAMPLIVILPYNPVPLGANEQERINKLVWRMNLKCQHAVGRGSSVCVLTGTARPADIAGFVEKHDGVMMWDRRNNYELLPEAT